MDNLPSGQTNYTPLSPVNLKSLPPSQKKKANLSTFLLIGLILVLMSGIGIGLYLTGITQTLQRKALECTNLEQGWHQSNNLYDWNGSSYSVPSGCTGYYYKCPGKDICPYLNNGCQLNKQIAGSGSRTTPIDPNFCGVQQADVNCDADVSPESYHTYWNITDQACGGPPAPTPTPKCPGPGELCGVDNKNGLFCCPEIQDTHSCTDQGTFDGKHRCKAKTSPTPPQPTSTPLPPVTLQPTSTPPPGVTITPPVCPVPGNVSNVKVSCPVCQ